MAFKLVLTAVLATLMVTSGGQSTPRTKYTAAQYLKNFALSTCLADAFKSDEVIKEAAAAAGGYLELGALPLEAHTEATQLGRKFLEKEYKSISGQKLVVMKCIDFFHSSELDQLARKYAGKK